MAKHMIEKDCYNGGYAIRVGGKKGPRWSPANSVPGCYATFETRARAEEFIAEGRMIEVTEIGLNTAMKACGWVEDDCFSDANFARFRAWYQENGVYYYAAPREDFFPSFGIREARKRGLSKIVMEDLS